MRLVYKRGSEKIAFPIDEGETFIGRKDYCEIYFPDASLSKRHARLLRRGGSLSVYDAGSRNGTLVNGELIDEMRLWSGDSLQCGKLRFRVEGVPEDAGSVDEFEVLEDDADSDSGRNGHSRSNRGSRRGSRGSVVTAKPLRSGELGEDIDVLPDLPPSTERQGAGSAPTAGARLKLVEGGDEEDGNLWDLTGETVTIGSKKENQVLIRGEGVSRYHAEVLQENGVWLVKDLGARNGIFVAGERIDIYELKDGDEIQIGTVKLRFEVIKSSPLEGLKEVLDKFKEDPAEAFKSDPRIRMGAFLLAAAFALTGMVIANSDYVKPPSSRGVDTHADWLSAGSAKLVAGEYKDARDTFRKGKVKATANQQDVARTLEQISNLWMSLHKDADKALTFRWEKAEDLIKKSAKLSNLPDSLRTWLTKQDAFVQLNKAAHKKLNEAEELATQASELATAKNFEAALDTYGRAKGTFQEIGVDTLFHVHAQERILGISKNAYEALLTESQSRMRSQNPDWTAIVELLSQADAYTQNTEQRQKLRRMRETCETNRRDESLYMRAVEIVQARQVDRYRDATDLLQQIDRNARIYPDAQAYIEWIEADLSVRKAKRAYDMGDARRAFQLLNQALQHEVLGPEARASVRSRRQKWARVVRAYERGMEFFQKSQTEKALEEFKRVIQFEPNRSNRFHVRAQTQIEFIEDNKDQSLAKKLSNGLKALQRGDWEKALKLFAAVRDDPEHTERELKRIRREVNLENKNKRLLANAKRDFLRDRSEKFIEMRNILKVLTLWLPKKNKDRLEAEKMLSKVVERLKAWNKIRRVRGSEKRRSNKRRSK